MQLEKINLKIKEIKEVIRDEFNYNNIKSNCNILTNISTSIKDILKDVTKDKIKANSRIYIAIEELTYLEELIEQNNEENLNVDFTQYLHMCFLITDAFNNIAHDTLNFNIKNNMYALKALSISEIENEIQKNSKVLDIISGVQYDESKSENNRAVYIVDIPHIGQVSWHMTNDLYSVLDKKGISQYPYKLEKDDNHVSGILLNSVYTDYKFMPHNALVQNVDEGKESQIREALDIYYKYSRNCATDKGREIITRVLSKEVNMSEQLLETLSNILHVDYSKIKSNILEQKKSEQEKQAKEERKSGP